MELILINKYKDILTQMFWDFLSDRVMTGSDFQEVINMYCEYTNELYFFSNDEEVEMQKSIDSFKQYLISYDEPDGKTP